MGRRFVFQIRLIADDRQQPFSGKMQVARNIRQFLDILLGIRGDPFGRRGRPQEEYEGIIFGSGPPLEVPVLIHDGARFRERLRRNATLVH